jgi:hypothetical protein
VPFVFEFKEGEMCAMYNTLEGKGGEKYLRLFADKPEQMRPHGRLDFRWRIIRKGTLTKYSMIMWPGVSGSRQVRCPDFVNMVTNFRSHKSRGIS